MSLRFRLGMLATLGSLALGCDRSRMMDPVLAYMECDECTAGELQAVKTNGDQSIPMLRDFLLKGPPPDQVERKRAGLFEWQKRVAHDSSDVLKPAAQAMLDNYTLRYKGRAANALKTIGTPAARAALCSAGAGPC